MSPNDIVSMGVGTLLLVIAVGLVVLGTAIGPHVWTKKRRGESRQHTVGGRFFIMLWPLPVIGVLAVVLSLAVPGLRTPVVDVVSGNESIGGNVRTEPPTHGTKSICGMSPVSDDLPVWVCKPETRDEEQALVVIVGGQFVTADEAEQDALEQAEQRLRADFDHFHPAGIDWSIPLKLVRSPDLLCNRFLRHIERTSGETTFHVQQMILQLELSPKGRELIYPVWRDQVVGHRLWILGRVLLLLTGILVTGTLYFRLDARTGGHFRQRLKLASVAVIVAIGILIETASPVLEQMM